MDTYTPIPIFSNGTRFGYELTYQDLVPVFDDGEWMKQRIYK
jgi:hypothetical protein